MPGIAVEVVIDAPASFVWSEVEDIASHVEWMHDAAAIRFVSSQTRGVGTRFECDMAVGPMMLTDEIEITEWTPPQVLGVRRDGLVSGRGAFRLQPSGAATVFSWTDDLHVPWRSGGPLAATAARPILRATRRRNLAALKQRVEHRWAETRTVT